MCAYTTSGFCGDTARAMRPRFSAGSPSFSRVHVLPASVLLWMPASGPPPISTPTCRRRWYVAAYSTSGSRGSMHTSVTPVSSPAVSTAFHVFPLSVVLYSPRSPPDAQSGPCAATYTTS